MSADHDGRVRALAIPAAVLRCAAEVAEDLYSLGDIAVDAGQLLTGRSRMLSIAPSGQVSAGGATHLLRALDGWCAITLSRRDDIEAVPALIEADEAPNDPWPAVRQWVAQRRVADVVGRARLLDVPVAVLGETAPASPRVVPLGATGPPRRAAGLLVADLTSMWAGPLCGQLLLRAGATVVKVESPSRPDGTRVGSKAFFDWMNAGKLSYAVDFDTEPEKLRTLLEAADVVLEGSRPAALPRRALGPHHIAGPTGRVWLRISGHGSFGEYRQRCAFGDDAAVAGGLVRWASGEPTFCGDAIADPLTGLTATREVFRALARGGGELIDVALAEVAACYAAQPAVGEGTEVVRNEVDSCAMASLLGADDEAVAQLLAGRAGTTC